MAITRITLSPQTLTRIVTTRMDPVASLTHPLLQRLAIQHHPVARTRTATASTTIVSRLPSSLVLLRIVPNVATCDPLMVPRTAPIRLPACTATTSTARTTAQAAGLPPLRACHPASSIRLAFHPTTTFTATTTPPNLNTLLHCMTTPSLDSAWRLPLAPLDTLCTASRTGPPAAVPF